jgi:FkbM family methyltransferase
MPHFKWLIRSKLHQVGLWQFAEQLRHLLRYLLKKPHEIEFVAIPLLPLKEGLLLDIGANIGQSAVSLRIFDRHREILSIEPNPLMKTDLVLLSKWLPHFHFQILGLSNQSGDWVFSVPFVGSVPLTQEGTFNPDLLAEPGTAERVMTTTGQRTFEIRNQSVRCSLLDLMELNPALIKLDVQGHELSVLQGAEQTLRRCRPVLMIENGSNLGEVQNFLERLDFVRFPYNSALQKLVPASDDTGYHLNYFFIPRERSQGLGNL